MTTPTTAAQKTILVIEDDGALAGYLLELLSGAGYAVELAPDGEVGMEKYLRRRPDLILTDIYMPHREGIGLINLVRASDRRTPIIAMSGGDPQHGRSYLNIAKTLGANASLSKPFTGTELLQLIQNLFNEHSTASLPP